MSEPPFISQYLAQVLASGKIPHALLFAGPPGVGKKKCAYRFAKELLETTDARLQERAHPDFFLIAPEGKGAIVSIDTLRSFQQEAYTAPFEAKRKVFFFPEADRMQKEAANALLKTLEEPGPFAHFLLVSSRPGDLLPTIRSRCIRLSFSLLPTQTEEDPLRKELFSLLAERAAPSHWKLQQLEKIEELLSDDPLEKAHQVEKLLSLLLMWFRDSHARKEKLPSKLLFFPDEQEATPWLKLEEVEEAVRIIQKGIERNLRLSSLLQTIIF